MPPISEAGQDRLLWEWTNKDGFSSCMTYKNFFPPNNEVSSQWKRIWKVKALQHVRVFLWLLWHGKILTNSERRQRYMTEDGMFPMCSMCVEIDLHALRDYTYASNIWQMVVPRQAQSTFFSLPFHDWLVWNLNNNYMLNENDMEWQTSFLVLCWLIWKARNEYVFLKSHRNLQLVLSIGITWAKSFHELDVKMNNVNSKSHLANWSPQNKGWIKLSSVGAVSDDGASIGGVLRDDDGNWLWGNNLRFGTE